MRRGSRLRVRIRRNGLVGFQDEKIVGGATCGKQENGNNQPNPPMMLLFIIIIIAVIHHILELLFDFVSSGEM